MPSRKIISALYTEIVEPLLNHCDQFWCPHFKKDVEKLESIQTGELTAEDLEAYQRVAKTQTKYFIQEKVKKEVAL